VSGLAHYLEDEGLATVIVALVREHIVSMRPPRALWVPFELGRPFGAPGNADLQRRVLQASLALLDKKVTAPLLEDFNEATLADGGADGDDNWRFPGTPDNSSVLAEAASIVPIWQIARERLGKTTLGISGLTPEAAVEFIDRFHSADPMPNPKGMAPVSRARFSIDDIKAFYFEAALAEGGHPSTQQLYEWLWSGTLAGALLRDFQERARVSDDKNLRLIAGSLVPAERTNWFLNGLEPPS
jgi:hypothetical protein